jgi:hypothetical protein
MAAGERRRTLAAKTTNKLADFQGFVDCQRTPTIG